MRASSGIAVHELGQQFGGRVVVARLELLLADQIFGVDDRLLHGVPAFVGRIAGEILAPHGEGFRVFLLPVIDLAQRQRAWGSSLQSFQRGSCRNCWSVATASSSWARWSWLWAICRWARSGQFVRGEAADEILQGRDAPAEIFVVAGLGAVPRLGQMESRLGRPIMRLRQQAHSVCRPPWDGVPSATRSCTWYRAATVFTSSRQAFGLPAGCLRPRGIRPAGSGLPYVAGRRHMRRETSDRPSPLPT